MIRLTNEYIREFCGCCDNFIEEGSGCSVLNETFRRKYLKEEGCGHAILNKISVISLTYDRVFILGEWYNRSDEVGIKFALEKKGKGLESSSKS